MRTILRCTLMAALVLGMSGCGASDETSTPPRDDTSQGMLTEADMPTPVAEHFDEQRLPTKLTDQGSNDCLGHEYQDLVPDSGELHVRKFVVHGSAQQEPWLIESSVLTTSEDSGTALKELGDRARACWAREADVAVKDLELGNGELGYRIDSPQGAFDAARGYAVVSPDRIALVSILVAPAGQDPDGLLKDLLAKLTR